MRIRSGVLSLVLLGSGCGAGFGQTHPTGTPVDAATPADLLDAPANPDAAPPASGPHTIASGTFVKGQASGGDTGSGGASLVQNSDGSELAVFAADFQATQLPAGEVVLTSRDAIGTAALQPGDLDLGPLVSSSGAQQYKLPGSDGGRRNLFVYCVTYGIDVAVARLK